MIIPPRPDFRQRQPILDHVRHTLAFYHPRAIDPSGGFYHFLRDDGSVFDAHTRHLVSSTRYVFVWAMAARHFPEQPAYLENTRRAVRFLREVHRNPVSGGYAWQLRWQDGRAQIIDDTNHCYGLAFVLLAYAHAVMAGLSEARAWLAHKGFDPTYGARPLARVIQQHVRNRLTDEILFGRLENGGHVTIGLGGDALTFAFD